MKEFKEKLAKLGVLDKFETNLENWKKLYGPDDERIQAFISNVQKDSQKLMVSFDWDETPEGAEFWLGVCSKLREYEKLEP